MKEFEGLSNAKKAGYAEKFKAEMTSFQSKHENFLKQMEKHGLDHLFAVRIVISFIKSGHVRVHSQIDTDYLNICLHARACDFGVEKSHTL